MAQWMDIAMRILGGVIALVGLVVVYTAPRIVKKYQLNEKKVIDPERIENLTEEEIQKYKYDTAVLDVKLKGVLIALPGFLIILIMFKL